MLQEGVHNPIVLETDFHLVLKRSAGLRTKVLYSGLFAMEGALGTLFSLSLSQSMCS